MNLEEMYSVLLGASGRRGVRYSVAKRWCAHCAILDGRLVTEETFRRAFERLAPNLEDLSFTQFVQFIGILARETKQEVESFLARFRTVQQSIIDEIQAQYRERSEDVYSM